MRGCDSGRSGRVAHEKGPELSMLVGRVFVFLCLERTWSVVVESPSRQRYE